LHVLNVLSHINKTNAPVAAVTIDIVTAISLVRLSSDV